MTTLTSRPRNRFYLVQRLCPAANGPGFDGLFACEYMGSAEYEFGEVGKSLKRIRAGSVTRSEMTIGSQTIYFVSDKHNTSVHDDFLEWLTAPGREPRTKEATYFPEILNGRRPEFVRTVAWWSLSDDVMFTNNRDVALLLVDGIGA